MLREFIDLVTFPIRELPKIALETLEEAVNSIDEVVEKRLPINTTKSEKKIEPIFGSVIYTALGFGTCEHSGIYVGNQKVIALNGKGDIVENTLEEFTGHLTTFNHEIYFPFDKDYEWAIGFSDAASRAKEMLGKSREYHLLFDNCHQFCAGCLSGDYENARNFLWMLQDDVKEKYGDRVIWKKWDWKK